MCNHNKEAYSEIPDLKNARMVMTKDEFEVWKLLKIKILSTA